MKEKWLCAICVLMMFSCSVMKVQEKEAYSVDNDELYINDSLKSIYYFTEGLKNILINNDFDKASENYAKSLELDSLSAAVYFQMAASQAMSNHLDTALIYSRKSVELDSLNKIYSNQLGQILVLNKHYDEAMKLYEKLLAEDQRNPNNYRMLAALYDYNRQPFTAIALLDSAEYKIGSRVPELSAYKRELLIEVKLYDKAISETMELIEENPYEASNYVILANLYGMINKDSLAVVNYQKAMKIDSTNTQTLAAQLDFYKMKGRNNEYLSIMRRVFEADNIPLDAKIQLFSDITINREYYQNNYFFINTLAMLLLTKYPDDNKVVELYANHLIRSGKLDQALDLYKNHINRGIANENIYYQILEIEAYLQRPDSVEKYAEKALAIYPDYCELYLRKGFAEQNMNKYREALKTYNTALKFAETDSLKSIILTTIGDMFYNTNKKKCFAYYEKALKLDNNNSALLNNYAYFLCESGTVNEKILEMSKKACELSPNNPTYLDTWGWILFKLGRTEEAKKIMQQAISFDSSKSSDLSAHYGDILFELGDKFLAEFYWKQALENGYDEEQIRERLDKLNGE